MKLVDKLEQVQGPFYTFEFFPPRTDQVHQIDRNDHVLMVLNHV
jgi:5,10-methylenetetrahydrofolate reductase